MIMWLTLIRKTLVLLLVMLMLGNSMHWLSLINLWLDHRKENNIVDLLYKASKNENIVDVMKKSNQVKAAQDPAENDYFIEVGPINGVATANYVYASFFQPLTAQTTVKIKKIAVRSDAVAGANYVNLTVRRISSSTGGSQIVAGNIPKKNTQSIDPEMQVRSTGPTVTFSGITNSRIISQTMAGAAGQFHSVRDLKFGDNDENIILNPGEGIAVYQEAAGDTDQRIRIYLEWEEVTSSPTAENEYLFAFPRIENVAGINYVYNSFFNPSGSNTVAIVKRMWFGAETCDTTAVYTNNIVLRRTTTATGGTQIASSAIPKKHTASTDSAMEFRHTGVTATLVGTADARIGHVTPCAVAGQPHSWQEINFHSDHEKLVLQPGEGLALVSEATGDIDQLTRMIVEWREVPVASSPQAQNEYFWASPRIEAAVAANTSHYTLFNPVGSGRTVKVRRLGIRIDADTSSVYPRYSFRRISASGNGLLINNSDIMSKNTSSNASQVELRWCGATCATAISATYLGTSDSTLLSVNGPGAVAQIVGQRELVLSDSEAIILQPGEGIGFYSDVLTTDVDTLVKIFFEWQEVASTPSASDNYLMDIGVINGSTTANYNYATFFNPSGSGRVTAISKISLRIDAIGGAVYIPMQLRRISGHSGGTQIAQANIPKKHTGANNSTTEVRRTGSTATYLGDVNSLLLNLETPGAVGSAIAPSVSGYRELEFNIDEKIILAPGEGIGLYQPVAGNANFRVKMLIEWTEVALAQTPTATNEFLLTTPRTTGSTTSGYVYASLFNPVDSGKEFQVRRLGIRVNKYNTTLPVASYFPVTLQKISSASNGSLVSSLDAVKKNTQSENSVAEVRSNGITVAYPQGNQAKMLTVIAPGAVNQIVGQYENEIIFGDELILAPGEGIALFQESAGDSNLVYRFDLQWQEINLGAPDLQQVHYRWRNDDGIEGVGGSNWYNSSWLYRKKITIDANQVIGSGDLTNYPFAFQVTDSDLRDTGNGGYVAQASGNDILFTDINNVQLDHEIERYVASTGALTAWIRIPTLSTSINTEIYIYYGNPLAANQENPTNVWSSMYRGVWHFSETSGQHYDSTANANHSSSVNVTTQGSANGILGGASSFSRGDEVVVPDANSLDIPSNFAIQVWVRPNSISNPGYDGVVLKGTPSPNYWLGILDNDEMTVGYHDGGGFQESISTTSPVASNTFSYLVYDHDDTNGVNRGYVNGSLIINEPTTTSDPTVNTGVLTFGENGFNETFDGVIDEVRVISGQLSSDWIQTEYNNHSNPGVGGFLSEITSQQAQGVSATWIDNEDSPLINASSSNQYRLRLQVSNESIANEPPIVSSFQLQFAQTSNCSTGTYVAVPTDASGHWQIIDSTYLVDGESTTNVINGLTDENVNFVAGQVKDAGNTTSFISLEITQFTELEFSIKPTANALAGENYCFALQGANTIISYAQAVMASSGGGQWNLSQSNYRWYTNSTLINVNDPWGSVNLAENQAISLLPATNTPPLFAQQLRLRLGLTVGGDNLPVGEAQLRLQYKAGNDGSCSAGTWTEVGASGSGSEWRFASSSINNGTNIDTLVLSLSDVASVYVKALPSAVNPFSALQGETLEYDFHLEHNGAAPASSYSFRVVDHNNQLLSNYAVCPTLTTRQATEQELRHGTIFTNELKTGMTRVD